MAEISDFVANNIWLCIGFGVILAIVLDEVLGLSRNVLGEGEEEEPFTPENRAKMEEEQEMDPLDALSEYDERGGSVNDLFRKR